MKALWKGSIGFGLVNIPVKLYSAVESGKLDFDMLDEKDHARVRFKRVNEDTGKEVDFSNIVKGYYINEKYVVLDDHDFEEAAPEKSKLIEIENFVSQQEIDPIYFETSYYTEPEAQGKKAYALLLQSLIKAKKAGVARFVLRSTENMCILHPYNGVITITKIRFQQQIRDTADIAVPDVKLAKKELDMGLSLIDQYTSKFDITAFKDEYTQELMRIIEAKAKGKRAAVKKIKKAPAASDDLYDQLMKSLQGNKKQA